MIDTEDQQNDNASNIRSTVNPEIIEQKSQLRREDGQADEPVTLARQSNQTRTMKFTLE